MGGMDMNFMRLIFLCAMSVMLPVWGAQVDSNQFKRVFDIKFSVGRINTSFFLYCGKQYIQYCKQQGIPCSPNEPFIKISNNHAGYVLGKYELNNESLGDELQKQIDSVTHVPLSMLLEGETFKKKGAHLFDKEVLVGGERYLVRAILHTDFTNTSLQDMKSFFKANPMCDVCGEGKMDLFQGDFKEDLITIQDELIAAGILAKIGDKIIHGPNGYFGKEEYEKELLRYQPKQQPQLEQTQQPQPEQTQQPIVAPKNSRSLIQKIMFGSLLATLGGGMYLLYKQYTEPAAGGEVGEGMTATFLNMLRNAYSGLRAAMQSKAGL